jgi:hypothetical protein
MPAIVLDLQKRFKLTISNGLPQALVENNEEGSWLRCCPLCGCIHKIQDTDQTGPYSPLCQTLPMMFKAQQTIWRKRYPDVTQYSTLNLIGAVH